MLPIVPIQNKKKKKTTHRPIARPTKKRCAPPANTAAAVPPGGAKDKAVPSAKRDDAIDNASEENNNEAASASRSVPICPALPPISPFVTTNPDLVLEADADHEDAEDAAFNVTDTLAEGWANETADETQDVSQAFEEAFNTESADDNQSTTPTPAPAEFDGGPLGPLSTIKTFTSQPPVMDMSSSHSDFLRYYYGNQAVGLQHALPTNEVKDDDNEEDEADAVGGEEEEGKKKAVRLKHKTLKSFCSKYPKPKKEQSTEDKSEADEPTEKKKSVSFEQPNPSKQPTNDNSNPPDEETGPQVEIINGEIVVRDPSLIGGPQKRTATHLIDAEFGTAIIEDESTGLGVVQAKYDSFTNRTKSSKWGVDETKSFYRALRQCGADFSMMQMFLPHRTRGQLKNKYKIESRRHPKLVDLALDPKSRVKLDLTVFGELEIPEEVPQISVPQVMITETPVAKKEEVVEEEMEGKQLAGGKAEEKGNSMESYFDHLFDDGNDDAMKGEDKEVATVLNDADTAIAQHAVNDKQSVQVAEKEPGPPALVPLAPVARNLKAKKIKKFKPMAKKMGAKK